MATPTPPLENLLVLELGHIVAGPSAGLALAELGADVVKIESRTGDMARNRANRGSTFYCWNRNKKSISLDLKSADGHHAFTSIVEQADVVIDNFSYGAMERLGIDYEWASRINPGIVYLSIKGFLPGEYESRPGLDELAQMESGLAYVTGLEAQPLRAGAPVVDIGAGVYGALAVLAAIHRRQITGRGDKISVGLFETSVFFLSQAVSRYQLSGISSKPRAGAYDSGVGQFMGWGVYDLFPTADGKDIFIAAVSDRQWIALCLSLGLEELAESAEFDTNPKRSANKERIVEIIRGEVAKLSYVDVSSTLNRAQVPYAPVNTPEDVLTDSHINTGGHLAEFDVPGHPGLRVPHLPVMFGETPRSPSTVPPPRLGEHTAQILRQAGVDDADIQILHDEGIAFTTEHSIDFNGEPS